MRVPVSPDTHQYLQFSAFFITVILVGVKWSYWGSDLHFLNNYWYGVIYSNVKEGRKEGWEGRRKRMKGEKEEGRKEWKEERKKESWNSTSAAGTWNRLKSTDFICFWGPSLFCLNVGFNTAIYPAFSQMGSCFPLCTWGYRGQSSKSNLKVISRVS